MFKEDIQPGYAPNEITYKGYTTKNLHHSADAAKAFQQTIARAAAGQIHNTQSVLNALKATDTYMKLNDMHLEQGKAPDEKELQQWKSAHETARAELNRVGEFPHHMDYWHMHEHEIQDMETKYNPQTAGEEMSDSYNPEGPLVQEDKVNKDSTYNAAKDILRYKDYMKLSKAAESKAEGEIVTDTDDMDPDDEDDKDLGPLAKSNTTPAIDIAATELEKQDEPHTEVGHSLDGMSNSQVRRMKVKYQNEARDVSLGMGRRHKSAGSSIIPAHIPDEPTPPEEVEKARSHKPALTKALDDLGQHFMKKYPHLRDHTYKEEYVEEGIVESDQKVKIVDDGSVSNVRYGDQHIGNVMTALRKEAPHKFKAYSKHWNMSKLHRSKKDAVDWLVNTHKTAMSEQVDHISEGSVEDTLYQRHQELRKKSGLPHPDYYKELGKSYDIEDHEERAKKQAEIRAKYGQQREEVELDEDFTKMSTPELKKWINTRQRNAMGGNLSKTRRDQHDQAQAELKKRNVNEELTDKTIRSGDKIKVARVIADMLGVENAESMSPEIAINTGLRKIKNKRMTPELIGIVKKMLALAQEVGVKVDTTLIPKDMSEDTATADYKVNPHTGRTYRAHRINFANSDQDVGPVETDDTEPRKHKTSEPMMKRIGEEANQSEEDYTEADLDKMVNMVKDEDDILDLYDDSELTVVDDDTGDEIKEDFDGQHLNEVLSRAERMRAKIKFARSQSKRERRIKIALKTRSNTSTINSRARKLAINLLKQRMIRKPVSQMSVSEKERVEKALQNKKALISRLALKLAPRIRKIENERLSHSKVTK
jgi:hypothetical protein